MRRSLRKLRTSETHRYTEAEALFTVLSLEEAKQRLAGRELADHCFFTWVRDGVMYYRVWADKRLTEGHVQPVEFGQVAGTLKRAEAEKLYIKAKRYKGTRLAFGMADGRLLVMDNTTREVMTVLCLPPTGGELIFEPAVWDGHQAATFVNALLLRNVSPDQAADEAAQLEMRYTVS